MHENVSKTTLQKCVAVCLFAVPQLNKKRNKFRNLMKHLNYFVGLHSTTGEEAAVAGKNIKKSNLYAK